MTLDKLMKMKSVNVIGVMNGTSLDDIDFVFCQIRRSRNQLSVHFKDHARHAFSSKLKKKLEQACQHQMRMTNLSDLHHELGRFYAQILKKILRVKKWPVHLIGLHGQTVYHNPPHATLQIGEPSYLATALKIPVMHDFRVADLALQGQGAPIATAFHEVLARRFFRKQRVSFHNLGGISNLTLIDAQGNAEMAFDTGPANLLIDLQVKKLTHQRKSLDYDGKLASRGFVDLPLLKKMLNHPYFHKKPPKSCGREEFGEAFLKKHEISLKKLSAEDQLATLTELTVISIAHAYREFRVETVVLCGGGAYNSFLKYRIQYHLPHLQILTTQDLGWSPKTIEGAAFALLGAMRLWEIPANVPKTTGAAFSVVLGKIC